MNGLLNEKAGCLSVLWVTIKHRSSNVKDSSIKLNIDGKDVVEPEMVAESLNNYSIDSLFNLLQQGVKEFHDDVEIPDNIIVRSRK